MIRELSLLKEIQSLDTEIISAKKLIDNSPQLLKEYEQTSLEAQKEYDTKKEALDKAIKLKKDYESTLEEITEKIKKHKNRTNDLKSNKEFQSHQKETQAIEKEKRNIEDHILDAMEKIDRAEKAFALSKERFQKEQEKISEKTGILKQKQEDASKELDTLIKKREVLARAMDEPLHEKYLSIFDQKNALAVVKVENEVCQGCYMNVPPQFYVEVMKNDRLLLCPQCGRILYYEPQAEDANTGNNKKGKQGKKVQV